MKSLSIIALAVFAATSTGQSFIVVEARTDGSASRIPDAFPSLDEQAIDTLHDDTFVVLPFDDRGAANAAFARIGEDLERENTLIEARVTLVYGDGRTWAITCRDRQIENVVG